MSTAPNGRGQLLQVRHDVAADWAAVNPILAYGEPGWDATNGILKIGDGVTPWAGLLDASSSGRQLARAEGTAAQPGITAIVDITGLTITFEVVSRPVDVILWLPWVQVLTAPSTATAKITDGAGTQTAQVPASHGISEYGPMRVEERILVPGTYTRKAMIQRGAGTGTITVGVGSATATHYIAALER